jgi:hypothetical protein
VALCIVFVLAAALYLWIAGSTFPLALDGADADQYNRLANAFLHLHLSIGDAPDGLARLQDPYDPIQNAQFRGAGLHDIAFYHGRLYETWGPTPALVGLLPLHLFGLAPSSSLVAALFAIGGLGFSLAALRVIVRQIGGAPTWMVVLAALALACATAVPFVLRRPAVYEEAITGGFFFAAAAIWLAVTAIVERAASTRRLVLMSLCVGLAAGARPVLAALVLMLLAVYLSLRATVPRRRLLVSLLVPVGLCGMLLMAYNAARFGNPFEVGTSYILGGYDRDTVHYGDPSYVVPGFWFYLVSPPRPTVLFPFLRLTPLPVSYPGDLPVGYTGLELTGGLVAMAPIVLFAAALAWARRWHSTPLRPLVGLLLSLVIAALAIMLFLSYEFFGTTERYEVDFAMLFLLAGLATWLTLSQTTHGALRRLIRVGGAILVVWGSLTGLAIGFTGYYDLLRAGHPGTWRALESAGSPLSTLITALAGRPVLADVSAPNLSQVSPVKYTSLGAGVRAFALAPADEAQLTVVSPGGRDAALLMTAAPGPGLEPRARARIVVTGPGGQRRTHDVSASSAGIPIRLPVHLDRGLNRFVLRPAVSSTNGSAAAAAPQPVVVVTWLSLSQHR